MSLNSFSVIVALSLLAGYCLGRWHVAGKLAKSAALMRKAAELLEAPAVISSKRAEVFDPSGARAGFMNNERRPLVEVPEAYAREVHKEGRRVFLHPFDPIEIDYFDQNGFQCWAKEGGYRIEGVRYYTESAPPAPALGELVDCPNCHGRGRSSVGCTHCNGVGQVRRVAK